jgi:asparagine synthase (glutamine-hydrolysing)
MCGISAIVRFAGNAADDLRDLEHMHRSLLHRGPDSEGVFLVTAEFEGRRLQCVPSACGHGSGELRAIAAVRRLRVSDLREEADQPLLSADGTVCVMLNGAIYNFRELAAELAAAGHPLRTSSDAEVVLEAYRCWGTMCFERFNGMWAIVILDLARRRLIGSRDRLGIKPLYFTAEDRCLRFCSEPAPLASALCNGPRIEPARFFEFLSGYPPRSSALTFFRDVNPVPAASWFEVDLHGDRAVEPVFQLYWDLARFHCDDRQPLMGFAEAAEHYRELLKSAIAAQSLADAKVGSLLSGGLDTSTIVSIWAEVAAARGSQRPETFSIAWDDPQMSERPYQEEVATEAGARGHTLELTPRDVWASVDQVVLSQGQPLLGQELIAQHHAYRLAHDHGAVVVLDGSGSDEVQAGLPPYEAEMVIERLAKLQLRDVGRELRCIARSYGLSYATAVRRYLIGPLRRHMQESRGLPRYEWLDERACDTNDPQWNRACTGDGGHDSSRVNRLLYRETRHTNVPAVLMYSDRNAMAHSVEARFPFLDHRIVEFCFSLPSSYKVGFGRRKRLLREASHDYVPRSVTNRRDKKFFVLLSNWMPLREREQAIRDASRHGAFRKLPWVDAARLHTFVDDYLARKHDNAYAVWRIYTASRWLELHGL